MNFDLVRDKYVENFGAPDVCTFGIGPEGEQRLAVAFQEALDRGRALTEAELAELDEKNAPPAGALR